MYIPERHENHIRKIIIMGDETYEHGAPVWVKLGYCWWPGHVIHYTQLPEEIRDDLRRPPYVTVGFFQEDSYEFVKNDQLVCPYNSDRKDDFIKRGMDLYRLKHTYMEKFPEDVCIAERKIGGDENILSDPKYGPTEKPNYNEIFGSGSGSGKKSKTKLKGRSEKTKARRSGYIITHRRFLLLDAADDSKVHIRIQPYLTPSPLLYDNHYRCQKCGFVSGRLDVISDHHKFHSHNFKLHKQAKTKKSDVSDSGGIPRSKTRTIDEDLARLQLGLALSSGDEESEDEDVEKANDPDKSLPEESINTLKSLADEWDDDEDEEKSVVETENNRTIETATSSCFDFHDEEESSTTVTTATGGRKIPRVIEPLKKQTKSDKEGDNDVDLALSKAVEDLLEDTESLLKPEQNFRGDSTIKYPDKTKVTNLTNPKKRFVKSFEDSEQNKKNASGKRRVGSTAKTDKRESKMDAEEETIESQLAKITGETIEDDSHNSKKSRSNKGNLKELCNLEVQLKAQSSNKDNLQQSKDDRIVNDEHKSVLEVEVSNSTKSNKSLIDELSKPKTSKLLTTRELTKQKTLKSDEPLKQVKTKREIERSRKRSQNKESASSADNLAKSQIIEDVEHNTLSVKESGDVISLINEDILGKDPGSKEITEHSQTEAFHKTTTISEVMEIEDSTNFEPIMLTADNEHQEIITIEECQINEDIIVIEDSEEAVDPLKLTQTVHSMTPQETESSSIDELSKQTPAEIVEDTSNTANTSQIQILQPQVDVIEVSSSIRTKEKQETVTSSVPEKPLKKEYSKAETTPLKRRISELSGVSNIDNSGHYSKRRKSSKIKKPTEEKISSAAFPTKSVEEPSQSTEALKGLNRLEIGKQSDTVASKLPSLPKDALKSRDSHSSKSRASPKLQQSGKTSLESGRKSIKIQDDSIEETSKVQSSKHSTKAEEDSKLHSTKRRKSINIEKPSVVEETSGMLQLEPVEHTSSEFTKNEEAKLEPHSTTEEIASKSIPETNRLSVNLKDATTKQLDSRNISSSEGTSSKKPLSKSGTLFNIHKQSSKSKFLSSKKYKYIHDISKSQLPKSPSKEERKPEEVAKLHPSKSRTPSKREDYSKSIKARKSEEVCSATPESPSKSRMEDSLKSSNESPDDKESKKDSAKFSNESPDDKESKKDSSKSSNESPDDKESKDSSKPCNESPDDKESKKRTESRMNRPPPAIKRTQLFEDTLSEIDLALKQQVLKQKVKKKTPQKLPTTSKPLIFTDEEEVEFDEKKKIAQLRLEEKQKLKKRIEDPRPFFKESKMIKSYTRKRLNVEELKESERGAKDNETLTGDAIQKVSSYDVSSSTSEETSLTPIIKKPKIEDTLKVEQTLSVEKTSSSESSSNTESVLPAEASVVISPAPQNPQQSIAESLTMEVTAVEKNTSDKADMVIVDQVGNEELFKSGDSTIESKIDNIKLAQQYVATTEHLDVKDITKVDNSISLDTSMEIEVSELVHSENIQHTDSDKSQSSENESKIVLERKQLSLEESPNNLNLDTEELQTKKHSVEDLPIEKLSIEELPSERLPIEELPTEKHPLEAFLIEKHLSDELPSEKHLIEEQPTEKVSVVEKLSADQEPSKFEDTSLNINIDKIPLRIPKKRPSRWDNKTSPAKGEAKQLKTGIVVDSKIPSVTPAKIEDIQASLSKKIEEAFGDSPLFAMRPAKNRLDRTDLLERWKNRDPPAVSSAGEMKELIAEGERPVQEYAMEMDNQKVEPQLTEGKVESLGVITELKKLKETHSNLTDKLETVSDIKISESTEDCLEITDDFSNEANECDNVKYNKESNLKTTLEVIEAYSNLPENLEAKACTTEDFSNIATHKNLVEELKDFSNKDAEVSKTLEALTEGLHDLTVEEDLLSKERQVDALEHTHAVIENVMNIEERLNDHETVSSRLKEVQELDNNDSIPTATVEFNKNTPTNEKIGICDASPILETVNMEASELTQKTEELASTSSNIIDQFNHQISDGAIIEEPTIESTLNTDVPKKLVQQDLEGAAVVNDESLNATVELFAHSTDTFEEILGDIVESDETKCNVSKDGQSIEPSLETTEEIKGTKSIEDSLVIQKEPEKAEEAMNLSSGPDVVTNSNKEFERVSSIVTSLSRTAYDEYSVIVPNKLEKAKKVKDLGIGDDVAMDLHKESEKVSKFILEDLGKSEALQTKDSGSGENVAIDLHKESEKVNKCIPEDFGKVEALKTKDLGSGEDVALDLHKESEKAGNVIPEHLSINKAFITKDLGEDVDFRREPDKIGGFIPVDNIVPEDLSKSGILKTVEAANEAVEQDKSSSIFSKPINKSNLQVGSLKTKLMSKLKSTVASKQKQAKPTIVSQTRSPTVTKTFIIKGTVMRDTKAASIVVKDDASDAPIVADIRDVRPIDNQALITEVTNKQPNKPLVPDAKLTATIKSKLLDTLSRSSDNLDKVSKTNNTTQPSKNKASDDSQQSQTDDEIVFNYIFKNQQRSLPPKKQMTTKLSATDLRKKAVGQSSTSVKTENISVNIKRERDPETSEEANSSVIHKKLFSKADPSSSTAKSATQLVTRAQPPPLVKVSQTEIIKASAKSVPQLTVKKDSPRILNQTIIQPCSSFEKYKTYASKKRRLDSPPSTKNKIMVVTNQQGQQQRVLLTPQQQKQIVKRQKPNIISQSTPKSSSPPPLTPVIKPAQPATPLPSTSQPSVPQTTTSQSTTPSTTQHQLVIQDALGNQTTVVEGQILALPSNETVDSYVLVTLDSSGNLTPLDNEALMSLDLSLQKQQEPASQECSIPMPAVLVGEESQVNSPASSQATDILAAALADATSSSPIVLAPEKQMTSACSSMIVTPIMTPLEQPPLLDGKKSDQADILSVPSNNIVNLPITVTDPSISQTLAAAQQQQQQQQLDSLTGTPETFSMPLLTAPTTPSTTKSSAGSDDVNLSLSEPPPDMFDFVADFDDDASNKTYDSDEVIPLQPAIVVSRDMFQ